MMITWRDALAALTFVFSAVTLWLRLSDRYKQNRRARRHRDAINADPVDPFQQGTDPRTGLAGDPAAGADETDGEQEDSAPDGDGDRDRDRRD